MLQNVLDNSIIDLPQQRKPPQLTAYNTPSEYIGTIFTLSCKPYLSTRFPQFSLTDQGNLCYSKRTMTDINTFFTVNALYVLFELKSVIYLLLTPCNTSVRPTHWPMPVMK